MGEPGRIEELLSPATPVQRSAELLCEQFQGAPVPRGLAGRLAEHATAERAHAVAEAALRQQPGSLPSLTLAADVALELDADDERAGVLVEQALGLAGDAGQRAELAARMAELGRAADALKLVAERLQEKAGDEGAQRAYAQALQTAHARVHADPGAGWTRRGNRCPCRSGRRWWYCCRRDELAALARFEDRALLDRLRQALRAWVEAQPDLGEQVAEHVAEAVADAFRGPPLEPGRDQAQLETVTEMALEHAWLVGEEATEEDEETDAEAQAPLARFARDPAVPPPLAAAARGWLAAGAYGVWQMHDPEPQPGVWLTDILTGARRYVAAPAEHLHRASSWTALLGPLVPVEGTWRTGGAVLALTPAEADRLAEIVSRMADRDAAGLSGRRPRFKLPKPGREAPRGVLAAVSEPAPPELADRLAQVLGAGIPQLVAELRAIRHAGPRLTNTDGDPLCIIKARIGVADPRHSARLLAAHLDVSLEDDGVLAWWGRELDAREHETALAELHAQLGGEPEAGLDSPRHPARWVRGRLRPVDGGFEVEVNSAERMTRLLELLRELGDEPAVQEEIRVDPAQAMAALRLGGVTPFGGSQEAIDVWLRNWPDQPLPALGGRTARRAAGREADQPRLEALLRELEHHAYSLARAGMPAPDVHGLREQLELPAERFAA